LKKLTIIAYNDPHCKSDEIGSYQVQFNPTEIHSSAEIQYYSDKVNGQTDGVLKFKGIDSQEIKLKFVLDGTGVSGQTGKGSGDKLGGKSSSPVEIKDVKAQVDHIKAITSMYQGDIHEVPYCTVSWADEIIRGRLFKFDVTYTLFKSDGTPIRAIVELTFNSSTNEDLQEKLKGKNSPDLTHVRTVQVGDTLPLMCQRIYKDSSYYLKVAKFNNLVDFRNLEPGTEIIFPPII
ncbi:MAG TPA: hypothetical protein VIK89_10585, partial [Cytophagaceae bacterium]